MEAHVFEYPELTGIPPHNLFDSFFDKGWAFFLDSGCSPNDIGRFSIIGYQPMKILRSKGTKIYEIIDEKTRIFEDDPFRILQTELDKNYVEFNQKMPFIAGAVGYLSYDLGYFSEGVDMDAPDNVGTWDMEFGFYDRALISDNLSGKTYASAIGESREICREKIQKFNVDIQKEKKDMDSDFSLEGFGSNFNKSGYFKAVQKVRDYIREGDTYQVNLSQRFSGKIRGDPWKIYKKLRKVSPAPFSAYLNFDETQILSSSPERFLKIRQNIVETRPIKGTIQRGCDELSDKNLKQSLKESVKDKSEHLMIVDLERNDLGKICDFGSVQVSELEDIETYSNVHHMVSTIIGNARKELPIMEQIKSCFPGGSITGAPKVRAMEIINELEPEKRGIYTGSIGYLGYNKTCDLNIVIRTMIIKDGKISFHVGGGIVYDSTSEGEYQETLDKAKGIFKALNIPEDEGWKK